MELFQGVSAMRLHHNGLNYTVSTLFERTSDGRILPWAMAFSSDPGNVGVSMDSASLDGQKIAAPPWTARLLKANPLRIASTVALPQNSRDAISEEAETQFAMDTLIKLLEGAAD